MEESGHWYNRDGSPCYEVRASNGGMRAFNLRYDRKLQAVPSVTTVTKIIDKPALTNWLIDQNIMAALTLPRIDGETEQQMLARIKTDGRAQGKAAADEGTKIHDAIEHYGKTGQYIDGYELHVNAAMAELRRLFPDVNDWVFEKSFAHPLGFGGKVDVHSPSTGIVCDWKGKDGDFSDGKKLAWDQHWQLAAYQVGLRITVTEPYSSHALIENHGWVSFTQCANIFVSRTHPGKVASHVWTADDIRQGWDTFNACLALWKILKGYDGSF